MPSKRQKSSRNGVWLLAIAAFAVIAVGGVAMLMNTSDEAQIALPTARQFLTQAVTTETPSPTLTPSPTIPAATLVSLPPTWTPSPTHTPPPLPTMTLTRTPTPTRTSSPTWPPTDIPRPTNTRRPSPTQRPTVDPALFELTYWYGDGDGVTMEDNERGGAYLRHFDLPVRVYIDEDAAPQWVSSVNFSVNLLNEVVPIRRVYEEDEATLRIWIVASSAEYEQYCPPESAGCATVDLLADETEQYIEVYSWVRIRADSAVDTFVVLHEMIHALGVVVHSPDPNDVMWNSYDYQSDGLHLTNRDRLILELLYSLPAIGEEYARPD